MPGDDPPLGFGLWPLPQPQPPTFNLSTYRADNEPWRMTPRQEIAMRLLSAMMGRGEDLTRAHIRVCFQLADEFLAMDLETTLAKLAPPKVQPEIQLTRHELEDK